MLSIRFAAAGLGFDRHLSCCTAKETTATYETAAIVAATLPECRKIPLPGNDHNFPVQIRSKGKLASYFSQILDLDNEPDPVRLRALLA